jgi:uncharacterized membrane protein YjfL (UPF0719 family)
MSSPVNRADRLLRDVLGESRYQALRGAGYIDLPSGRVPGRVYRLDSLGNLSCRELGETGFSTTLCVQPEEVIPRDDQIAMRYLLVTADEERLIRTANRIAFGFVSLAQALYYDFSQRHPRSLSALMAFGVIAFFLLSLVTDAWALSHGITHHSLAAGALFLLLLAPALVGLVLVAAGVAEGIRAFRTWRARRRRA